MIRQIFMRGVEEGGAQTAQRILDLLEVGCTVRHVKSHYRKNKRYGMIIVRK